MKLYVMFGQRKERYEGEHGPEALDFIWDENCVDENPQGFEEACAAAMQKAEKDGFRETKLFIINVDGDKISRLLHLAPEIAGTVEEA